MKSILFVDWSEDFNSVNDLTNRPRGGRVNSLYLLPVELTKLGYRCYVLGRIKTPGVLECGVQWLNKTDYPGAVDYLVCNRGTSDGYPYIRAKHRILWTHDLPHTGFCETPKLLKAFSATVFMSKYGERAWRFLYKTIGKGWIIPNAVDRSVFKPGKEEDRDLFHLIYISAPNRGLNHLPIIFAAVRYIIGDHVTMTAYSNLNVLHPHEPGMKNDLDRMMEDGFCDKVASCEEAGVAVKDPVQQIELSEHLSRSGAMIMPTSYPEICSNAILQSLTCGTPVITTGNLGSSCEWIRHGKNGMLSTFQPYEGEVYGMGMVRNIVKVLKSEKLHRKLIQGATNTPIYTWKDIAHKWDWMLRSL